MYIFAILPSIVTCNKSIETLLKSVIPSNLCFMQTRSSLSAENRKLEDENEQRHHHHLLPLHLPHQVENKIRHVAKHLHQLHEHKLLI